MTGQRTLALVSLLAASVLCVATVEIRTYETGDPYYRFLVWNLILAWVPLAFAIAAYSRAFAEDASLRVRPGIVGHHPAHADPVAA